MEGIERGRAGVRTHGWMAQKEGDEGEGEGGREEGREGGREGEREEGNEEGGGGREMGVKLEMASMMFVRLFVYYCRVWLAPLQFSPLLFPYQGS